MSILTKAPGVEPAAPSKAITVVNVPGVTTGAAVRLSPFKGPEIVTAAPDAVALYPATWHCPALEMVQLLIAAAILDATVLVVLLADVAAFIICKPLTVMFVTDLLPLPLTVTVAVATTVRPGYRGYLKVLVFVA
jgi:hypothetical protein